MEQVTVHQWQMVIVLITGIVIGAILLIAWWVSSNQLEKFFATKGRAYKVIFAIVLTTILFWLWMLWSTGTSIKDFW